MKFSDARNGGTVEVSVQGPGQEAVPEPVSSWLLGAAVLAFGAARTRQERVCDINVEPFEGVAEPRPAGSDTTSAASSAFG